MASGGMRFQTENGSTIRVVLPNGLPSSERTMSLGSNLSGVAPYHLLQGNLSISNEVISSGVALFNYTGNTTIRPVIDLGMDILSQWGVNYITGDSDETEQYGYLIKIKSKNTVSNWIYVDSIRGITKFLSSDTTAGETVDVSLFTLANTNGTTKLTLGTSTRTNTNGTLYTLEVHQTTHIRTGTTNHGKAFVEHYNPFTLFSISSYTGSGIDNHELPHSLGQTPSVTINKLVPAASNWIVDLSVILKNPSLSVRYNTPDAWTSASPCYGDINDKIVTVRTDAAINNNNNLHIMYAWADGYLDKSGKLIGNYEAGYYHASATPGHTVKTKGKPAWIIIKALSGVGHWIIIDNQRGIANKLAANSSAIENDAGTIGTSAMNNVVFNSDGFTLMNVESNTNAANVTYMYMVFYDNDSGSGKSKYKKTTDTSMLQANNLLIPFSNGIDTAGVNNSIIYKNETIPYLTSFYPGKNYVYANKNGVFGISKFPPQYGKIEGIGDYCDLSTNKWYKVDVLEDGNTNKSIKSAVPRLESDSSIDGKTISSGVFSNYYAFNAFNGNVQEVLGWVVNNANVFPVFIGYKFNKPKIINKVVIWNRAEPAPRAIGTFRVEASNDGVNWVTLSSVFTNTNNTSGYRHPDYAFSNSLPYYYYRVYVLTGLDTTYAGIGELRFIEATKAIGAEITEGRNYLNSIVHADIKGQITHVEELEKITYANMIETSSNRVVIYLEDYGIPRVQAASRYILDNPFGNDKAIDCDVKAEIFVDGYWGESGWDGNAGTGPNAYGTVASSTVNGIVIKTGNTAVYAEPGIVGGSFSNTTVITSAQARIIVTYKGKTRELR